MKSGTAPSLHELKRIVERLDEQRIADGLEMPQPLSDDRQLFLFGGRYVKRDELLALLARRLLALHVAVGLE